MVTTLGVTHLDFDIESNEETNAADYTLTAQALAQVRSWASANGRQLSISYTLPMLPSGLTSSGTAILQAAQSNSFTPNVVNIMTMDYGSSGTEMAPRPTRRSMPPRGNWKASTASRPLNRHRT